MPRVQIVLEVADAGAIGKIKDFSRAVHDSFGTIKAGDPALKGATVNVRNLTDAKVGATRATRDWQGVLTLLPGQLGAVTSQAASLTTALGRAGLAGMFVAAAGGAVLFTKSLADDIERLDNLKVQTGLSVAALQAFEQAAKEAGEAPETLVQGLGKVNAAINDVLTGAPNAGKAFQAIGVDLRELVKAGASTEDILEATARALVAIEDPTRRAAAQMELFGTRGRAMSTVLGAIAKDGVGGYTHAMREAGIVTSEETNRMAREFDVMYDRITRSAQGFLIQLKADTAAAILNLQKMWELTKQIFADPAAAGLAARGQMAEPGAVERAAGRTTGPTTRELAPIPPTPAQIEAAEERARKAASDIAQIFADMQAEIAAQALGEDLGASAFDLAALDAELKKAKASLDNLTVSLTVGVDATTAWLDVQGDGTEMVRLHTQAIGEQGGELETHGQRVGDVSSMLATFRQQQDEARAGALTLTGALTDEDRAFFKLKEATEAAGGAVERMAERTANAVTVTMPTALEQFRTGLTAAGEDLVQQFASWEELGRNTAGNLFDAFSNTFFLAMKGDLEDLDDAWEGFFNAVLRHIADFLAAQAVNELLNFIRSLGSFSFGGSSGGGSSGGGGGFDAEDALDAAVIIADAFSQQKKDSAQLTDESRRRLEFEQKSTQSAANAADSAKGISADMAAANQSSKELSFDWGKAITGGLKGAAFGSAFGPAGAFGGAIVGGLVAGFDLFGRAMRDLKDRIFGTTPAVTQTTAAFDDLSPATAQLTASTYDNISKLDGYAETLDAFSASVTDLAATQTDLAVEVTDLTDRTAETTEALDAFSDGLEGLGEGIAAAVEAAAAAAEAAAGSAEAAAGFGADAGKGFGGQGTPGGAPDVTPDSPQGPANDFGGGGGGGGGAAGGTGDGTGGTGSDRAHGLLEGPVPGPYGSARWMRLHGGETVNTPDQAEAILRAIQGDPEDRALMREQNELLRAILRRGGVMVPRGAVTV